MGLPWWLSDKESVCQCRRCGFDHQVGKIPWRRKCQPTPVLSPGKSHGQRTLMGYSPWGHRSWTWQQLNNNTQILICCVLIFICLKAFSNFPMISFFTYLFFRSQLFNFDTFVNFPFSLLLLISRLILISLWLEKILGIIFYYLVLIFKIFMNYFVN